jgi:uncharacterized protein with ParB-like and HNH nuclease domain
MEKNALLDTKLVGDIRGEFIIPEYQRGYRWRSEQVSLLLKDIWENGDANYCLQPLVVKKIGENRYELIDGQQRLTTIFLITKYLKKLLPFADLKYSLSYITRSRSAEFLASMDSSLAEDNIDFSHMHKAYKAIDEWFSDGTADKGLKAINLYKYFGERVKFIWYEVDSDADSIALFARLNIGKIPLTNAELIKALFLSKDTDGLTEEKQLEIATSWDIIERELQNNAFWSFLTNEPIKKYATRIELLFDMIANKGKEERDPFFTFFYFSNRMKSESKKTIWKEIQEFYLIMVEWFQNRDIYHKVGYLVAIGKKLQSIIKETAGLTKSSFDEYLNKTITNNLGISREGILELNYKKNSEKIERILLLFNVEAVRILKHSTEKYSFETHKKKQWSLEHIHAQNSDGLNKKEDQQKWLSMHRKSLEDLVATSYKTDEARLLIKKIDDNFESITKVIFDTIFVEVFAILSESDDRSYMDSISNMALLSLSDNAALNNSTFDVKRNKILEMDKNGEYIPICTRRVFLKYYTESEHNQMQFWSDVDRKAYLDAILGKSGTIVKYLNPSITPDRI